MPGSRIDAAAAVDDNERIVIAGWPGWVGFGWVWPCEVFLLTPGEENDDVDHHLHEPSLASSIADSSESGKWIQLARIGSGLRLVWSGRLRE